jgi:hypothetical protein
VEVNKYMAANYPPGFSYQQFGPHFNAEFFNASGQRVFRYSRKKRRLSKKPVQVGIWLMIKIRRFFCPCQRLKNKRTDIYIHQEVIFEPRNNNYFKGR